VPGPEEIPVATSRRLFVILGQVVAGWLIGFGAAFGGGVGDGWELVVIPLGNALGVWVVGVLAARRDGGFDPLATRALGAVLGGLAGSLLIVVLPGSGYEQLLLPMGGALLGYYLWRARPRRANA
jgi:hypothetical protein